MPDDASPPSGRSADHDGHTIAVPFCDKCPPLSVWPMKNLVLGGCPRCGKGAPKAWRMIRARRLMGGDR